MGNITLGNSKGLVQNGIASIGDGYVRTGLIDCSVLSIPKVEYMYVVEKLIKYNCLYLCMYVYSFSHTCKQLYFITCF